MMSKTCPAPPLLGRRVAIAGKTRPGPPGPAPPAGRLRPGGHALQHPGKPHQRRHQRPPDRAGDRPGGAGVTANDMPPERLNQHIWDLEHLGCKVLVLCPTTEQGLFNPVGAQPHSQLQAKPACTRKLRRALADLINPRPPAASLANRWPAVRRASCVSTTTRPTCCWCKPCSKTWGPKWQAVDSGYAPLMRSRHKPSTWC
jgi:two-component system, NarL family, sensor histidine kinase BarA